MSNDALKARLKREGVEQRTPDPEVKAKFRKMVDESFHHLSDVERDIEAHVMALTHPDSPYAHKPVPDTPESIRPYLKAILIMLGILILLTAASLKAHAQKGTSQIDVITIKNGGAPVKSFAAPFTLNCGTNMTCGVSGSTLTLTSSGGGAATGYQTIQNAAAAIAQETTLNWTAGIVCADNAGASRSDCALANIAAVSHKFFNSVVSGALVLAQPSCADLSDAGTACTAVAPANTTATAHNFFTAYNSGTGAFTKAQPACGDLSDSGTLCASSAALAVTIAQVAHKWLDSYTSSTGAFTQSQPACGDLSNAGTLCQSSAALAANTTATAHNFFTAYNSTTGAFTKAQPVCGDLSDAGTLCTSSAALAQTIANVSHKWLNSYTASTGAFTQTQPACADLSDSGTACTAVAPANTTATSHNFFTAYTAATGAFTKAQPACGDLSDAAASCATDATNAANIGSGTLPAGRMPALTGAVTSSAGAVATSPGKADVLQANQYCADAGASDTYACNLSPAITAYVTGTHYWFKANTANTGAASINFNAAGALTIKKPFGGSITADLADNDIRVGQVVEVVYDGTNAQMVSQLGNTPAGGSGNPCTATASSVQFNNAGAFGCASQVTSDGTQIAAATSATKAGFNLPSGTAPTTPLAGDFWQDTSGIEFFQASANGAVLFYDTGGNAVTEQTSGTITSYTVNKPLAASSGIVTNTNASGTVTQNFSGDSNHSIAQTGKTAAISTATLCAATANTACGQVGTYEISWNFWGSGTACASVTAGQVTFLLTWTDENAVTHSAVAMSMDDQTAAAVITRQSLFHFETALANESASGVFQISTNGSVIQYATGYTACTTGTGTYNLRATVTQIQ